MDLPTGLTRVSGPNGGGVNERTLWEPPAQREKNGLFGTPKVIPMIKTMCASAPTQHQASLLRAEAEPGHNAGWKAPIKMPNAQVKGHEAPA